MADANGRWDPLTWRDKVGVATLVTVCVAFFIGMVMLGCYWVGLFRTPIERRIAKQIAWAEYVYDYSENQWCVNAVRRDAKPGEYVGGCFKTRHEADEGILKK